MQWGPMIDSNSVAILCRANELIERYGMGACDVVVTMRDDELLDSVLAFENPPESPDAQARFFRMVKDLGIDIHKPSLSGSEKVIYSTLISALGRAPRIRGI